MLVHWELGMMDQSYSVTVAATDPDSTVTYAVTSGSLPPNTTLNASSGVISTNGLGSIGSSVTYSFTITATSNSVGVAFLQLQVNQHQMVHLPLVEQHQII